MANTSKIEWTDATWNPWIGCQKVSPGCDNCYAEAWDLRFAKGLHWGPHAPRLRTSAVTWSKLKKMDAGNVAFAAEHGRRRRVFVASMADVFDNAVPIDWAHEAFEAIAACSNLDVVLLTKRIQQVPYRVPPSWLSHWPQHIGLMVSAVNTDEFRRDVRRLLALKSKLEIPWVGVSCEPMLGPISNAGFIGSFSGELDWVICGGESGPHARQMHPEWARDLRDSCAKFDVPFFFKQWGEWLPGEFGAAPALSWQGRGPIDDCSQFPENVSDHPKWRDGLDDLTGGHVFYYKAGKAKSGRLLDGEDHNAFPALFGRAV